MSTDEVREQFIRSYLTEEEINRLAEEARKVSATAWATYSKFNVGACLLTHDGEYITGCNIENISYTQTIHAEGCIIAKAISAKKLGFKALAVYAKSENFDCFIPPCGECRQFLSEFVNFLPIILVHESGCLAFEFLHELLPLSMVLGSTAPKSDKPTVHKYDSLVFKANGWILKDIYTETRSQMRQLLRDLKFDEIEELTKEKLRFKEAGVLATKFRTGPASINFNTVQELFEAFAITQKGTKGKVAVTYHGEDKLTKSITHRIVATLNAHNISTSVANKESSEGVSAEFKIHITSKGERAFEIRITDGQNALISKDLVQKIYEQRDKLVCSTMLNKFYCYKTNTLLTENDFASS